MNLSTLNKITYGLYIVSSKKDDRYNGQVINTLVQVTVEPCRVAVIINKKNLTHEFIETSKIFSISILGQATPLKFIGLFGFNSGRKVDKFKGVKFKIGARGSPIVVENSIGYIECEVEKSLDVGTHTIFVGQVWDAEVLSDEEPMTYAFYHDVKRGKTHVNAPTYRKEEISTEVAEMTKYKCTVCGYIYDPAMGDPEQNIKPDTPFEALPDDWVCPICGAAKDKFVKI